MSPKGSYTILKLYLGSDYIYKSRIVDPNRKNHRDHYLCITALKDEKIKKGRYEIRLKWNWVVSIRIESKKRNKVSWVSILIKLISRITLR